MQKFLFQYLLKFETTKYYTILLKLYNFQITVIFNALLKLQTNYSMLNSICQNLLFFHLRPRVQFLNMFTNTWDHSDFQNS